MKEIANLCLDHNVDFEVMHGDNNNSFRTAFLIEVGETIRVDFGAASHGSLVSRVHVASDHKIVVKIDELVVAIVNYRNAKRWGNESAKLENQRLPYHVEYENDCIVLTGEIVKNSIKINPESTEVSLQLKSKNLFMNTVTNTIHEGEETFLNIVFDADGWNNLGAIMGATRVKVAGRYVPGVGIDAITVIPV